MKKVLFLLMLVITSCGLEQAHNDKMSEITALDKARIEAESKEMKLKDLTIELQKVLIEYEARDVDSFIEGVVSVYTNAEHESYPLIIQNLKKAIVLQAQIDSLSKGGKRE